MSASSIDAVVAELRQARPDLAGDADSALGWLTGGEGPEVITQARVQRFCWYTLPVKVLTTTEHHHHIAAAAAAGLDRLGLERYGAICRSATTAAVIDAFAESMAAGHKAYRKAEAASGVYPPVTDRFEFGAVMGPVEADAWDATANRLELAIAGGELTPGSRAWKTCQGDLVDAFLHNPDNHAGPGGLADAIRAERLDTWHTRTRSPTRRDLFEPLLPRLAEFPDPPDDAAEAVMVRLGWLLEAMVDGGQRLTQTGNLNRALVQAAADRFDYPDYFNPPASEFDLYDLHQVRAVAQARRLVRKNKGTLVLTPAGKAVLANPATVGWRHLTQALIPTHPFDAATGHITLAVLATRPGTDRDGLTQIVATVIGEEGWHSPDTGATPDERTISTSWHQTTNLARALGLTPPDHADRRRGRRSFDTIGLTPVGQRVATDALRHVATGPRDRP